MAVALIVAGKGTDLIQTIVDDEGVALVIRVLLHKAHAAAHVKLRFLHGGIDAVHRHALGVAVALIAPVGHDDALIAQSVAQVVHGFLVVVHMHGVAQAGTVAVGHDPLGIGF